MMKACIEAHSLSLLKEAEERYALVDARMKIHKERYEKEMNATHAYLMDCIDGWCTRREDVKVLIPFPREFYSDLIKDPAHNVEQMLLYETGRRAIKDAVECIRHELHEKGATTSSKCMYTYRVRHVIELEIIFPVASHS